MGHKKDSIIDCIVETEKHDAMISMDMWYYILQNHMPLDKKEDAENYVDDVLKRFCIKYKFNSSDLYDSDKERCQIFINHIAPHLNNNELLLKAIFGQTSNAGYFKEWIEISPKLPTLLACVILTGNSHTIKVLIKSLVHNRYMYDISFVELLLKAKSYIDFMVGNEKIIGKCSVNPEIKNALIESLEYIDDKKDRAECTIAFLSL